MKRLITTTIIITIIAVLLIAILNSCVRIKSYEYQSVVSYESNSSQVAEITEADTTTSNLGVFGSLLKYEQILLISSIVLVIIFTFIFFNLNPKKRG